MQFTFLVTFYNAIGIIFPLNHGSAGHCCHLSYFSKHEMRWLFMFSFQFIEIMKHVRWSVLFSISIKKGNKSGGGDISVVHGGGGVSGGWLVVV